MRTNIVLDDHLVTEAFKYAPVKTKKDLINLALVEYVQNHKRLDVRNIRGKVSIDPAYSYKELR